MHTCMHMLMEKGIGGWELLRARGTGRVSWPAECFLETVLVPSDAMPGLLHGKLEIEQSKGEEHMEVVRVRREIASALTEDAASEAVRRLRSNENRIERDLGPMADR
jgi:hypothetical protein